MIMAASNNSNLFISKQYFDEKIKEKKEREHVLNWTELKKDVVFKIVRLQQVIGPYGKCCITHMIDRAGDDVRVWAPKGLLRRIKREKSADENVYIVSLGQELKRIDHTKRNNFDFLLQKEPNAAELKSEIPEDI